MKKLLARTFLKLMRWKVASWPEPGIKKGVIIGAPHTSNWDFPLLLAHATIFDYQIKWMGKDALFTGIKGPVMRALGGVAVDRSKTNNFTEQLAKKFAESESLILVVPASGTRSYRDYWKSGFYYIAREAGVPIILSYLDYGKREGGIVDVLDSSLEIPEIMDRIREFYEPMQGKFPKNKSRIRLRIEDELEAEAAAAAGTESGADSGA